MWRTELAKLRDLYSQVAEYGGIDRLREDIRRLEHELTADSDGIIRWEHTSIAT